MTQSALVGLLVGPAAALVAGPRPHVGARRTRGGSPGVARARRGRRPRRADDEGGPARLAAVLIEVAALLRAGTAPADAWSRVLRVAATDRVPTVAQLAGVTGRSRREPVPPLAAVVAAARVADELGAPLAAVLDQVAAAIAAQAQAAADVDAALAGPRSSARILAWLPVLGVLLGTALGADPLGMLLGGGLGTAAGVAGGVLMLAGRWWSNALLRRVVRMGSAP